MTRVWPGGMGRAKRAVAWAMLVAGMARCGMAQTNPVERTFPQSKSAVEKALKQLQPAMSGHLPTVEGFAQAGDRPLGRYQRAFYQCTVQVSTAPSGGSVVRVSTKVTAWYADPNPSRSGYQLLTSNGRVEGDLLDQLSDQLSSNTPSADAGATRKTANKSSAGDPAISAPMPRLPITTGPFSSTVGKGLSSQAPAETKAASKQASDLQIEADSLEEVLKNQAHPKNLVAVKKSGTPVVAAPSLTGKTLFLASEHDEFEMLDFNNDWVHVRVSGLARGWIWRTSLEMPGGFSDVPQAVATSGRAAGDLFQVSREERAPFPGDWEPLRGKSVKIISVQKIQENEQGGGATAKLEYAKALLNKSYEELAKSPELAGVVLIFDSVDGGMIAATVPTIQQWKAGTLTDAALWHQCYFDPPETFSVSSASGSR